MNIRLQSLTLPFHQILDLQVSYFYSSILKRLPEMLLSWFLFFCFCLFGYLVKTLCLPNFLRSSFSSLGGIEGKMVAVLSYFFSVPPSSGPWSVKSWLP